MSSAIVVATIYIGLNMMLSALASWMEQRRRRPLSRPLAPTSE